jgi:hypothetical protein
MCDISLLKSSQWGDETPVCWKVTCSKSGVFNSYSTRSGACWFSVLPDNELHTLSVPGLNQSLIRGEQWKKCSRTGFEVQSSFWRI